MNINEIKVPSNNSLKNEIEEIVKLCCELEEEYTSVFNPPVTNQEIFEWENKNGVNIPESYKAWLEFSNGCTIRGMLAKFYGLEHIMADSNEFSENLVVIGEVIGDGTRLCFTKDTGEFVWCNYTKNRKYSSFSKVLNKLMDMM